MDEKQLSRLARTYKAALASYQLTLILCVLWSLLDGLFFRWPYLYIIAIGGSELAYFLIFQSCYIEWEIEQVEEVRKEGR